MHLLDSPEPCIIAGNQFVDDRGSVSFINDFDPLAQGVRRLYTAENVKPDYIRAWHGHKKEGKFVLVTSGMAMIQVVSVSDADEWVKDDAWRNDKAGESPNIPISRFVLCGWQPKVLWIPPGFYNGFKTLKENTNVIFFSTSTLEKSKGDDYRLDWDVFGAQIWEEKYR